MGGFPPGGAGRAGHLSLLLLALCLAGGDAAKSTLRVATCDPGYKPFSFTDEKTGELNGHDVVMWRGLYARASSLVSIDPSWAAKDPSIVELFPGGEGDAPDILGVPFSQLIDGLFDGSIDVGFCGIYEMPDRAAFIDFLPSYLNGGIRAMVRKVKLEMTPAQIIDLMLGVPDEHATFALQGLAFFSVIYAHLIWYVEKDTNQMISPRYTDGLWDSFWLAIVTACTVGYGDKAPKTYAGKVFTLCWMFIGMFFVGLFAGSITSELINEGNNAEVAHNGIDLSDLNTLLTLKVGASFQTAKRALEEEVPGAQAVMYPSQKESLEALERGEVDVALEDLWQAEYISRLDRWSESIQVSGPKFWDIDSAIVVARPDGREHPAMRLLSIVSLDYSRGTSRQTFEKNRKIWFGTEVSSPSLTKDQVETQIIENLRGFNRSATMFLCSLLAVWCFLALLSNRRRIISSERRHYLRNFLGIKEGMSQTSISKKIHGWYRELCAQYQPQEISMQILEKVLDTKRQKTNIKDLCRLKMQYLQSVEPEPNVDSPMKTLFDISALKDITMLKSNMNKGHDADEVESNASAPSSPSLRKPMEHRGFVRHTGLSSPPPPSRLPPIAGSLPNTFDNGERSSSPDGHGSAASDGGGSWLGHFFHRSNSARSQQHRSSSPDGHGSAASDGGGSWLGHFFHRSNSAKGPSLYQSRRHAVKQGKSSANLMAATSGNVSIGSMGLRFGKSMKLEESADYLSSEAVSMQEFHFIVMALVMPKEMDLHTMSSHAPAVKKDIVEMQHAMMQQFNLMSRQIISEVQLVPKAIGEDVRLEAKYFEEWQDWTREQKALRRFVETAFADGVDEEEPQHAAAIPEAPREDNGERPPYPHVGKLASPGSYKSGKGSYNPAMMASFTKGEAPGSLRNLLGGASFKGKSPALDIFARATSSIDPLEGHNGEGHGSDGHSEGAAAPAQLNPLLNECGHMIDKGSLRGVVKSVQRLRRTRARNSSADSLFASGDGSFCSPRTHDGKLLVGDPDHSGSFARGLGVGLPSPSTSPLGAARRGRGSPLAVQKKPSPSQPSQAPGHQTSTPVNNSPVLSEAGEERERDSSQHSQPHYQRNGRGSANSGRLPGSERTSSGSSARVPGPGRQGPANGSGDKEVVISVQQH
mmetsp:Transcript_7234/g.17477  ORF Transcript_7234/g.17477 Transcript_7234/m.17477 type:complete len:1152 (+) Transcript_7234:112-3567(+)